MMGVEPTWEGMWEESWAYLGGNVGRELGLPGRECGKRVGPTGRECGKGVEPT